MKEKILENKKHGMLVLVLSVLLYIAATAGTIAGAFIIENGGLPVLFILSLAYICIGWLPWLGL